MTPPAHQPERHCGHECVCTIYIGTPPWFNARRPCERNEPCPHDTRRESGQQKVWLVAIVDYDEYDLRYVCLSEETALKRFDELRKELIERNKEMIAHDIEEGIDPSDWIRHNLALETWAHGATRTESGETPEITVMELEV